jgi:hypothetical protein
MDQERTNTVEVWVWPSARSNYFWNLWPGDYTGMTAGADGAFHAFWIDNRTGVGELYTASVTVQGAVERPGGKELASLENITSALEIQYTSSVWNPRTKTVSLEYQFLNTSHDTIAGPLKVRVVQLESDLGRPTLIFPDGRFGVAGSAFDVSHAIPSGGLAPGQTSKPQKLKVKFDRLSELPGERRQDVVHMKMMMFGARRKTSSL